MQRDTRSRIGGVNLSGFDTSPRAQRQYVDQSANVRRADSSAAYERLAASLNQSLGQLTQTVAREYNRVTEAELRLQQQRAKEAALEAYTEFRAFKESSWDPETQDLSAEAQRIFNDKFGEKLSGYSVFDTTLKNAYFQMTSGDIVQGRVFQAQQQKKQLQTDLSSLIQHHFSDPNLRGDVSSETLIDWKNRVKEIDKTLTEGEAFAFVFKNLNDAAATAGGSGVARLSQVLHTTPINERGDTFAKLFPAQSRKLLVDATTRALDTATIGTRQFALSITNKARELAAQDDIDGLIELHGQISDHISREGGENVLGSVRSKIDKLVSDIVAKERTIKNIHDVSSDPTAVSSLSKDELNDYMPVYLQRMGLGSLRDLDAQRLVTLSTALDNIQQGRGYIPESVSAWFTNAVGRSEDPAVMEKALMLADSLSPGARKSLFAGNEHVATILNAYRDMKDAGVTNAAGFIKEFLEDPKLAERYRNFSWQEYGIDNLREYLQKDPWGPTSDVGTEIIRRLQATGQVDDVDFFTDLRLTPAALDKLEKAIKLRVLIHEKDRGFVSPSDLMSIRTNAARALADTSLVARKVATGGLFSADEWVIDAHDQRLVDWGGPDNYLSAVDDFGRQEVRAPHVNAEITNPMGIRENPVQNLIRTLDELPDYLDGFDGTVVGKALPDDPSGAMQVHIQQDAGMPTLPMFLQSNYTYEINGKEIRIPDPDDLTPENLRELADSLPPGVYPQIDAMGQGVTLLVYPHFRGMDGFKNKEALQAGPKVAGRISPD